MATYAIGDVQGCYVPFRRLLDHLGFDSAADRLWFVGDLVNRGPQSLEVLRYVKALGAAATVVLGNHDLHLLMLAEGHSRPNKEDSLEAVLTAPDRDELLDWLRARPLIHVDGAWAMVHAGLLPDWTVEQAKRLSDEVSVALNAPNYREFLATMWGSEPNRWDDGLSGWDRLRVVVNAMTRMRYITVDGAAMELRAPGNKSPPGKGPEGCVPWFNALGRRSADHTIVCGHWSSLGLYQAPNLVAIDTGCLWGGSLTALRLDDRRLFCLPCPQYAKPGD